MTTEMRTQDVYREWKGWSSDRFAVLSLADHVYFAAETADSLAPLAGKNVLEMGFGNGGFLAFCRDRGARAVGVELDADLVERARGAGFEAYVFADGLLAGMAPNQFDAVVAFDVFEHVEYGALERLLRDLYRLLRPGGVVLARFPSGDSPFSGAMYNGDCTHRTLIGSGKLKQLTIATGFDIRQMRGARMPIGGLGVRTALKRSLVVAIRRIMSAILIPAFYSNVPRVVDPNAVCVLRKPDRPS